MKRCTVCEFETQNRELIKCPNCGTCLLIDANEIDFHFVAYPIPLFNEQNFINENVQIVTNIIIQEMETDMKISNIRTSNTLYYGTNDIYFEYEKTGLNRTLRKEDDISHTNVLLRTVGEIVNDLFQARKCVVGDLNIFAKAILPEIKQKSNFQFNYIIQINIDIGFRNFK